MPFKLFPCPSSSPGSRGTKSGDAWTLNIEPLNLEPPRGPKRSDSDSRRLTVENFPNSSESLSKEREQSVLR
jgi:hypothetical protein